MKILDIFYGALILTFLIGGVVGIVYYGGKAVIGAIDLALVRHEQWECGEWADYAKVFRPWDPKTQTGYYLTQWQYDQCKAVGMPIENVHVTTAADIK